MSIASVIAWFAIVFTAKMPEDIHHPQAVTTPSDAPPNLGDFRPPAPDDAA